MFLIGIEVLISKSPQINSAEKGPKKFPKYYFWPRYTEYEDNTTQALA